MGQITSNLRYALEISLIRLNVGGTIYDPSLVLHIFSQLSIPPFHLDMVQHQSTKLTDFHDARLPTAFYHRSNFIENNLKFPFLDYLSNGISVRALNDFLQEIASAVAANEVRSSTSEGDMLSRLEATYFSPLHTLLRSNRSDASEAAGFTVRYFENMSHRASAGGGDESVCQGRGRDVKADLMSIEIKPEVIVSDRQIRYLVYLVRQGVVVGNPNTGSVDVPDWDGENEHGASYENHENVKRVLKQVSPHSRSRRSHTSPTPPLLRPIHHLSSRSLSPLPSLPLTFLHPVHPPALGSPLYVISSYRDVLCSFIILSDLQGLPSPIHHPSPDWQPFPPPHQSDPLGSFQARIPCTRFGDRRIQSCPLQRRLRPDRSVRRVDGSTAGTLCPGPTRLLGGFAGCPGTEAQTSDRTRGWGRIRERGRGRGRRRG